MRLAITIFQIILEPVTTFHVLFFRGQRIVGKQPAYVPLQKKKKRLSDVVHQLSKLGERRNEQMEDDEQHDQGSVVPDGIQSPKEEAVKKPKIKDPVC